jgi:hypothetical protein
VGPKWEKGCPSPNPGGRPKTAELRELCKTYTEKAVQRLVELLDSTSDMVKMKAACELLDRAWGKPVQATVSDVSVVEGKAVKEDSARDKLFDLIKKMRERMDDTAELRLDQTLLKLNLVKDGKLQRGMN